MDWLYRLDSDIVTTSLWVILIVLAALFFGRKMKELLMAMTQRIQDGSPVEIWKVKFGTPAGLQKVHAQQVQGLSPHASTRESADVRDLADWTAARDAIGKNQRGVHLAHQLRPTTEPNQEYELLIYLVPGANRDQYPGQYDDLRDVKMAEFYLGQMWGDRITRVHRVPGRANLGIRTTAYAPVVCLCKITFSDGNTAVLSRFIDFEMGRLFQAGD